MEKNKNLNTVYNPQDFEKRIYDDWLNKNYFDAKVNKDKKPFTIVMPPPNITGKLHMGHALDLTLQDMIIRTKRMQGYEALWLPGSDHASIATEVKVENELLKRGIKKKELGREKFLEEVYKWSDTYQDKIREQVQKMGSSADFKREAFTMDKSLNKAVNKYFKKLYEDGLIYRGDRITNWCPKCQTALSDAEIEYVENEGHFWNIKYPIKDSEKFLIIATTRPETMLGDTAVAVNPKDERFNSLIGKSVILPLMNKEIPIIGDDYVDIEVGTGALKITPAHDPNDFKVGERHNLESIRILNDKGEINENGGIYEGLDRYEAREKIVSDLKKEGLLDEIKAHIHNVNTHDRCGTVIEPIISKQWYVKMEPLAGPAIEAVKKEETKFVPKRFEKTYFHWLENIEDWCISRQLWWGHRIPVYYCDDCGEVIVSEENPGKCTKCSSSKLTPEEDVLDTWFSSALWPFSTLGWPDNTEELNYFYPTNTLVTGYDIIPFWVMRMMFTALYNMEEVPFDTVFIHGIVRDEEGRKMSKSLDNGVDPLIVIDEYGADALRFMLISGNAPGSDIRYQPEKVESSRNFANKIWNASRFVLMNIDDNLIEKYKENDDYTLADRWILSRINSVTKSVTENIENYELGIALTNIYDFFWNEFCDWYIELTKPIFYHGNEKERGISYRVIKSVLIDGLKLLHPIMPFITEEIYSFIGNEETIMLSSWPQVNERFINKKIDSEMDALIEAITSVRNIRQEMGVPSSKKSNLYILPEKDMEEAFELSEEYLLKLAYADKVIIIKNEILEENFISKVNKSSKIYIPLLDLVEKEEELKRLNKEKKNLEGELLRVTKKLLNKNFVEKAKEEVVLKERLKEEKYKEMLDSILKRIEILNK